MSESDILHALEDTQFPQKLRGYDPAEVDDLIDRASREIADLRAEHKAALDRAELAERRLDQELDATEKARATAEAEIATAEAEGRRIVAEAESEAATLRAATDTEVREAIEAARQRLLDETASLEAARDAVRDDISIMERHIDAHRERLLGTLGDLRKLIESAPARPLAEGVRRPSVRPSEPVSTAREDAAPEPATAAETPRVSESAPVVEEPPTSEPVAEAPKATASAAEAPPERPATPPQDLPTLAVAGEGLLDELRQSVGSEGAAMDAFFTDED
jgi:DivIVA domain-containing protein